MVVERNNTVSTEVSEFIMNLIPAFLKTGYYMSEHPEAKKAISGLYNRLKLVLKDHSEISFLSVADGREQDIFIVGITDEPLPVSSPMLKSMSDIFVERFSNYFERKCLSAFTFKKSITQLEFEKFISIMTESPYANTVSAIDRI